VSVLLPLAATAAAAGATYFSCVRPMRRNGRCAAAPKAADVAAPEPDVETQTLAALAALARLRAGTPIDTGASRSGGRQE
jgi:hypothetical protein